jgi:hypothetical protein
LGWIPALAMLLLHLIGQPGLEINALLQPALLLLGQL